MPTRQSTCSISGAPFSIDEVDLAFYERIGVPPPTLCPEERTRRRMAFANQRLLFHRTCAATGKKIISNVPPEDPTPIYDIDHWFSDKWDHFATGRDYDFRRPFFEQFQELCTVAPRPALQRNPKFDENSDYTNYAGKNKNCYLIFDSDKCEDCLCSYSINSCRDVVDCFRVEKSELCYECIDCVNCYRSIYLQNCDSCSDSAFLKNCIGCTHCFGCVNLRQKKFYLFNEPCSPEVYRQRVADAQLSSSRALTELESRFRATTRQFPERALQGTHNENVVGDYLTHCKNAFMCFDSRNLWDCRYIVQAFDDARDCMDCTEIGDGAELLYETCYTGYSAYGNRFSSHALGQSANLTYCYFCPHSSDCFGCVGLHHARFCILNKRYSEEDYRALVGRIVSHMTSTREWGEFFPAHVAPFPYNLTHAHEYYPLQREEALRRGYRWRDQELPQPEGEPENPPDSLEGSDDSILNMVFTCANTQRNYKLQRPELAFYRKMNLPPPRLSPDERHFARVKKRNGRTLYNRRCAVTGKEIRTTVSPDQNSQVVSEEEFAQLLG